MPASIVLTGLDASNPLPGVFMEVDFAQGPSAGSDAGLAMVVLANRTTAGSATPDTTIYGPDTNVPLQTEADMIALGGTGSEAHRIYRRITKVNQSTAVYWVFVAESVGAAATGTITIATTATGVGSHRTWVGDEFADTPISTGDTAIAIAGNIVTAVNAKTHWPVTAANGGTAVVTLTAKQKGLRGNWTRFMAAISSGIGSTTTATADGFLSGGTTADSNATALATILPKRFYYIVSAAEDASQFGAVVSQVGTQAQPTNGIRQRAFAGSVDTLSNATTVATGINSARGEITWHEKSTYTPAELAGQMAAVAALFETRPNPRTSYVGFGNDSVTDPFWTVLRSRTDSASPTTASIKSALNNGLSPVGVNPNGSTYLVNRITTRSLNGATADYRIRPSHKVTICDFFADDLYAKLALQNAGKRIGNDPPKGGRIPGPQVVTPQVVTGQIFGLINDYDQNDLLQNVPDIKTGTQVQRETNPSSRMTMRIPLQTIDNLEQQAGVIQQVA